MNRKEAENGHNYSYISQPNGKSPDKVLDYETIRERSIEELIKLNPSIEEEYIFECWMDGVYEPRKIAAFLEIPVKKVNNETKKLNLKLLNIRKQLKPYFDGR